MSHNDDPTIEDLYLRVTEELDQVKKDLLSRRCPRCEVDSYWYRACQLKDAAYRRTFNQLVETQVQLQAARMDVLEAQMVARLLRRIAGTNELDEKCPWLKKNDERVARILRES